ncbi:MAG: hypothetical protein ACFFEK_01370 [Candidatus Thorarchaeota archaeon]
MVTREHESDKKLSSVIVALALSGFGVLPILVILMHDFAIQALRDIILILFGMYLVVWIYFGGQAVVSKTPEWSTNAKRLEGIGFASTFIGFMIASTSADPILAILLILTGTTLTLIAVLHPSSRLDSIS